MRRTKLSPAAFFKISAAALAFALGLAAEGLRPRQGERRAAEPAAAAALPSARAVVAVRDTRAADDGEGPAVFEGRYENFVYGYSVRIPAGMVGAGSPPPMPQHGFGIDLDDPRSTAWVGQRRSPDSYVSVDGSYNSLGLSRLDEAADDQLSYLREKGSNVRVLGRTAARLGGLRAVRVVARYEKGGEERVSESVVALGRRGAGEASVVYTLDMDTPLTNYGRDRPVLEALLRGWRLQAAP